MYVCTYALQLVNYCWLMYIALVPNVENVV